MDPLASPEGRWHIDQQLQWLPLAVDGATRDVLGVEYGQEPPLLGIAWDHAPENGWLEELRVLTDLAGAGRSDDPDSWAIERFHSTREENEAAGAALMSAMRQAGDARPEETIAAAVAAELRPRHWENMHPAPGFVAWTRRAGRWTRVGEPEPPLTYPDMPHLSRWISDDALADRLRTHIAATAARIRAVLGEEDDEWCGVALFATDDESSLGVSYLFALSTRARDASADPAALLDDPGSWEEMTPGEGAGGEGHALAQELLKAEDCYEPEAAFHLEVVARLQSEQWPGVRVSEDMLVLARPM